MEQALLLCTNHFIVTNLSYNIQMQDIAQMKARMLQRVGTLTDYVTMRRENYLMTLEENRTVSSLICNATQRTQADQRIEWLEKLISATRIQHIEAERRLAAMNASSTL